MKKKEEVIVVCAPRRARLPQEIENGWEAEECACEDCGTELMRRLDPDIPSDATILCMACAGRRIAADPSPELRMTKQNEEAIRQLGHSPEELMEVVTRMLGIANGIRQREQAPLRMRLLRAWWRINVVLAKVRYRNSLVALSGMSDSEFMRMLPKWRSHPAYFIRAACSRRWVKITWPNDPVSAHEDDARLMWERQND